MFLTSLITRIIGSSNQRTLRQLARRVRQINALEPHYQGLKDEEFAAETARFREALGQGQSLEQLLPEVFAAVREAAVRTLGLRMFDVQLMGGMVLNANQIAEMKTGEGKTLTALLPCYLNALSGQGVHVVTVNDYLASRDAAWSRPFYAFMGMSVGCNIPGMDAAQKRAAYACDVTYGTNNEFGFDYLRDNMAYLPEQRVQRGLHYALIDEVDSVLIDEARTPLIISGAAEDSSELYRTVDKLIPRLQFQEKEDTEDYTGEGHYTVDLKLRQAYLTERGQLYIEELLQEQGLLQEGDSLFSSSNILLLHHVMAALRAHTLFKRDVDYVVTGGEVVIIDEHSGRKMTGRRWADGLHQAVEAKEGVEIRSENQTLASITFQNYFRMYAKLAGMTGTADTEAYEFQQIYGLRTIVLPTNMPMIRKDYPDLVYLTEPEKFHAIIADIKEQTAAGRPVLAGTISIENSEKLSALLREEHIPHQVLNAKYHEQEAQIIAQAGRPGTVTIATNMAGRGTDIILGGNLAADLAALGDDPDPERAAELTAQWQQRHEAVVAAGGLHIIGSERHESRRIDNQLRGRSGRQGDPGSSRFYLSMDDNLMRLFGSDRLKGFMARLGMGNNEPLEHRMVTRAIESAQRKVETRNFDIRKNLLEYDDVANQQRQVIYEERNALLDGSTDTSETIAAIREDVLNAVIDEFIPQGSLSESWDVPGLEERLDREFMIDAPVGQWLAEDQHLVEAGIRERIMERAAAIYADKCRLIGEDNRRVFERNVMLHNIDLLWKEHLAAMDYMRQGIGLQGYAQKNPKNEYKIQSYNLFTRMLENLKFQVIRTLSTVQVRLPSDEEIRQELERREAARRGAAAGAAAAAADAGAAQVQLRRRLPRDLARAAKNPAEFNRLPEEVQQEIFAHTARNARCPCGSGRKFKDCHGKITAPAGGELRAAPQQAGQAGG